MTASILLVAVVLSACSDGGGEQVSRAEAVRDVVDRVIAPAYRRAIAASRRAASAASAVCADDSPVSALRDPVAKAYGAWRSLDPIDFGPATELRAKSQLFYAPDPDRIARLLAAGGPADAEAVNARTAASARGYGAAEILVESETEREARCRYVDAVLANGRSEADAIGAAWFDGRPPYVTRARGEGPRSIAAQDMLDMIVNMSLNAIGADAASVVASRLNEEDPTVPIAAAREHLDTIAAWWGRDANHGIRRVVDEDLGRQLAGELARASAADDAKAFGEAINAVRATLGTEVVAALDVTVAFSDNDGDS